MINNKLALAVLFIGVLGILSNFLLEPVLESLGVCDELSFPEPCFNLFYRGYVESVALFSAALVLVSLLLFFVDWRVNRPWLVFACIYAVVYVILVVATPPTSGFLQPQRDLVSLWLSVVFVIISLLLIAYKSWRIKA